MDNTLLNSVSFAALRGRCYVYKKSERNIMASLNQINRILSGLLEYLKLVGRKSNVDLD